MLASRQPTAGLTPLAFVPAAPAVQAQARRSPVSAKLNNRPRVAEPAAQ